MAVISVFVSSTFRDFHGERDVLVGPVRAALDELVRPFGCRIEMVDLRWGVGAGETDDPEAAQRKILDVCLSEIGRSRPLFVGLVGNRYGWIPPEERARRVATEAGLDLDIRGRSVTELEFIHGTGGQVGAARSVFFVRDLKRKVPTGWNESDPRLAQRSESLRDWVMKHPAALVYRYRVKTDGVRVQDLRGFEALAIQALGPVVVQHARFLASSLDFEDPTAAAESLFFAERTAVVEGRDSLLAAAVASVNNGESVCLTGTSGVGKSAVWCTVVERLRASGCRVVAVPVGAVAGTTSERAVVSRLAAQLDAQIPESVNTTQQLRNWWRELVAYSGALVIAADSLDSLDNGFSRDELGFLTGLPGNASFFVSTTDATQFNLVAQTGARQIVVGDLAPAGVERAAASMTRALHRELPADAMSSLVSRARSPLWLTLAVGELMALDEDDFATVDPTADAVSELAKLVTRTVEALPADIDGVINAVTERAAQRFGMMPVASVLRALAVSRSGLTPSDLGKISGLSDVVVAGLKRALGGMVEVRGVGGRLGFVHGAVKAAIARTYLSVALTHETHVRIAQHLNVIQDDDPIRQDDALWHTLHCEGVPSAGPVLNRIGDTDAEPSIRARRVVAQALAGGIDLSVVTKDLDHQGLWTLTGTETSAWPELNLEAMHQIRVVCVQHARRLSNANSLGDRSTRAVGIALSNLADVEMERGNLEQARAMFEEWLAIARDRCSADPTASRQRDLVVALHRAAHAAAKAGANNEADALTAEGLQLAQELAGGDIAGTQAQRDVALSLLDVGAQARIRGDNSGAFKAYEDALQIWRGLVDADPENDSIRRDMSVALNRVGELARQMGDSLRAREALEEALEIRRRLLNSNPGSTQALRDVTVSLANVGRLARSAGAVDRAHDNFTEALRIARQLLASDRSNAVALRDVSVSLGDVGDVAVDRRDWDAATDAFEEALQIRRQLSAENPTSVEALRDVAVSLDHLAGVARGRGDMPAAQHLYEQAAQLWRRLYEHDPGNAQAARDLVVSLMDVGHVARNIGDLDGATDAYSEAVQMTRARLTGAPRDAANLRGLKQALDGLGEVHRRKEQLGDAWEVCEESLRIAQIVNEVEPGVRARRDYWSSLTLRGRVAGQGKHLDIAGASFKEALLVARELHQSRPNANTTRDLLGSLQRLRQFAWETGDLELVKACDREAGDVEGS